MDGQTTAGEGKIYAGAGQFVLSDGSVSIGDDPTVTFRQTTQPASMEQTVLEDEGTHPAYMNIMFWATIAVAILGGGALLGVIGLSWNDKTVPDALGTALQWALFILGGLLVGDVLLSKLAVKA